MWKFIAVTLLFFYSCSEENPNLSDDAFYHKIEAFDEVELNNRYQELKTRMNKQREGFKKDLGHRNMSEVIPVAKKYLYKTLNDSLFHFWLDTKWDFNGITEIPRSGSIACGYFVTTTLRHAGFKIDRVKLAQQAASIIINTLCDQKSIKIFSNKNLTGLKEYFKSIDEGLYIIGLDNHVGFIQKKDTSAYMIHSSGVSPHKVMIQNIHECGPVLWSSFHMIGNLLGNKNVLEKWIKGEEIPMKS